MSAVTEPTDAAEATETVAVVAATSGYGEYGEAAAAVDAGVYVGAPGRPFRAATTRVAFYRAGAIQPEVPAVLAVRTLVLDEATVRRLRRAADGDGHRLAALVRWLVRRDPSRAGAEADLVLLSPPDSPATVHLPGPVPHRAAGRAFARTRRYVTLDDLLAARTTADLDPMGQP